MIWIILLYLVITIIAILVCYSEAKEYHYTVKYFLIDCLIAILLPPVAAAFLLSRLSRLIEFIKIKFPRFKINTSFITEFLNKTL